MPSATLPSVTLPSVTLPSANGAVSNNSSVAKKPTTANGPVSNNSSVAKKPTTAKNVKVGVWSLRSTEFTELEAPENTESLFSGTVGESVIGQDSRRKVKKIDFMPGGKYRSIVKLFLRFAGQDENSPWALATGWLISDDTFVTAGHCVFDWSHNLGRLTHVKAYIGYSGKESITDSRNYAVQFRTGKRVAAPSGWLADGKNELRDVAFIQVDRPFTGIKPFKYQPTPVSGTNVVLGVVGYPGDLMNPKSKEKGAFMYEMYDGTTIDIPRTKMLQYTIDTYGGNSGSPVIRQSDMASIGVHVLGGNPNSASVISGPYGNPFDAYVTALKGNLTGSHESEATVNGTEANWLSWITVPTKEQVSGGETDASTETGGLGQEDSMEDSEGAVPPGQPDSEGELEEGFFNILKKALKVAGPFGMVASAGLNVAGTLLGKKREAAVDEAYSFEGVAERALLGEAALEAVVHLGPSKCKDLGIFKRMQPTVIKLRPICRHAGPTIMPFVMERAWRMTMAPPKGPPKKNGEAAVEPARTTTSADTDTLGFGPRLDANAEAFVQMLTESLTTDDAESFADTEFKIGGVIRKGLRIFSSLFESVAESGLSPDGTEAAVDPDIEADLENPESSAYTYDAMTQRAIAGEAALRALIQTPVETLKQEGLVNVLKGPLTKYGPKFLKLLEGVGTGLGIASAVKDLTGKQGESIGGEVPTTSGGKDEDATTTEKEEDAFLATLESGF